MQKEIKSDIQSKDLELATTSMSNIVSPHLMLSIGSWNYNKMANNKTKFTKG